MTRRALYAHLFCLGIALTIRANAQSPANDQPQPITGAAQRDPEALAIVSNALQNAGGAAWAGVGTYQIAATATKWDFATQSWPVVIAGQRSGAYRFEVDGTNAGALVEVTNGVTPQYTVAGSKPQITPGFLAVSRPIFFPLSYLAEIVSDPNISLSNKGKTTVDARAVLQVDVANVTPRAAGQSVSHLDHFTKRSLYFDAASGVLIRISDHFFSPRSALSTLPRVMDYADYQADQGLTFPHLVRERIGSREFATITIQSVVLNPGLPSSVFSLQQ